MRTVICPGSFNPVTNGHMDIIKRASGLFDEVIVLVARNYEKTYAFTDEERLEMIEKSIAFYGLTNVRAELFDGLLIDYVRESGACAVVKGLRAVSDFEYEFQMAMTNRVLYNNCETIFLTPAHRYMYLSSSIVRQVGALGGDISKFVPEPVKEQIQNKLNRRKD